MKMKSMIKGIYLDEFSSIPKDKQKKLIKLMTFIMERAYRRGVQQAIVLFEKNRIKSSILEDLHSYRYDIPLTQSPGLDGFKTSSIDRLRMEECLEYLGFDYELLF